MKLNKQIESIITVVESLKESQVQLFEKLLRNGLFLHHKNRSKMGDTVYESPTSI